MKKTILLAMVLFAGLTSWAQTKSAVPVKKATTSKVVPVTKSKIIC